ncbi:MAG TPA: hypothetical protein VHV76_03070 [Mycobacteriales bacterium]|jgi:hypothetical protein|nr:hypothetical protein [Mycobacteriales bacterium]
MTPRHATLEHGTGTLADLVADARAIPMAAYGVSRAASKRVIDLTEPAQRAVLTIPAAAASLIERGEHAFADYLR